MVTAVHTAVHAQYCVLTSGSGLPTIVCLSAVNLICVRVHSLTEDRILEAACITMYKEMDLIEITSTTFHCLHICPSPPLLPLEASNGMLCVGVLSCH